MVRASRFAGLRELFLSVCLLTGTLAQAAAPAEKQQVLWDRLRTTIGETERGLDGVLGVAILDLSSGQELIVHPDEVFPQASSIKIAVLAELYRQAGEAARGVKNNVALTDLYIVRAEDLVAESDIMGGLTPGTTRLTLKDLATMMVAVSDNSATNVLIDRVGMARVEAMLERQGLRETHLRRKMLDLRAAAEGRENVSTPREMMTLLERLYRGEILSEPWREGFFQMLSTHKQGYLTHDLPDSLRVASKPGWLDGVRNDSGVVFLDHRPYIICVMTTYLSNERRGEEAIASISAAAYAMFDRFARASEYGRTLSPPTAAPAK
jgi:beta-lactamase class A